MKKFLIVFVFAAVSIFSLKAQGIPPSLYHIQAKATLSWNNGIKLGLNVEYRDIALIPQPDGSNFNIGYTVGPGISYHFSRGDIEVILNADAAILGVGLVGADAVFSFAGNGPGFYLKPRLGFTVSNFFDLGFGWYFFGDRTLAERAEFFLGADILSPWTMPRV